LVKADRGCYELGYLRFLIGGERVRSGSLTNSNFLFLG